MSEMATSSGPVVEANAEVALSLTDLRAGYGRTIVLRDVSMQVPAGSVVALLGPNGAGKTTLIKTVSGLLPATGGTVEMFGEDVTKLPPEVRSARYLCTIPEGRGIYRSLTVRENLRLQSPKGKLTETIERASQAFPVLGQRLDQQAGTMSGGEQQMLSLAAAYVRDPRLVIIDEASLGLAPIIVDTVFEFVDHLRSLGASMLIVDQFVQRALAIASKAYILNKGSMEFEGTPQELLSGNLFERYLGHQ
ncbi:MAG: ABC transporter ATP-binding protein [Acidimicrobiia bacterium]